ncbi:MAG: MFS transporter [Chloroflexia bacterium]
MAVVTEADVEEKIEPEALIEKPKGLFGRMKQGITKNVFLLGIVAFFTDVSSEMIVPIRIIFLVAILRTPLPIAGLIEGVAESTASLLKIVSGRIADRPSKRPPLVLAGYVMSNGVKPLLAFVTGWPAALGLIFVDRVGKGVRGAPRDAMLADATPKEYMGKAFGFHRSMDTFGAAVGPLLTYMILLITHGNLQAVFAWTGVPGALGILAMLFVMRAQKEKRQKGTAAEEAAHVVEVAKAKAAEAKLVVPRIKASELGVRFWMFTAISTIFAIGNSSDSFIFLRTADLDSSVTVVPLLYFAYNMVYAILATPLGSLSDRWGRIPVMMVGYASFAFVYFGFAVATQVWQTWALFLIYGIYAAATDGVSKAFVADMIPKPVRGTAMGWFNGMVGFSALPANLLGGWLWSVAGAPSTFIFGAWMSLFALFLAIAWMPWLRKKDEAQDRLAALGSAPAPAIPSAAVPAQ